MLFADASNTFMGEFVYAGIALLVGLSAGVGIMVALRKPAPTELEQPINTSINGEVHVRSLDKFATRDFCDMRHRELGGRVDRVERDLTAINARVEGLDNKTAALLRTEVGKVHDRVNELDKTVGGLSAATEIQNDELNEIKRDIKTLLQRQA